MRRSEDVARIREALRAAAEVVRPFTPGAVEFQEKADRAGPVTEADRAVDEVLHRLLPMEGEGWLSEETADTPDRLGFRRAIGICHPPAGAEHTRKQAYLINFTVNYTPAGS